MDADLRAHLLIIEKQLVASKCTIETALAMIAGALDAPHESAAEQALPAGLPAPSALPPDEGPTHRVFGGGAAGEPRPAPPVLTPGADGLLSRAP